MHSSKTDESNHPRRTILVPVLLMALAMAVMQIAPGAEPPPMPPPEPVHSSQMTKVQSAPPLLEAPPQPRETPPKEADVPPPEPPVENPPDETPKAQFHFADETLRNIGAAVNGKFLGGLETVVFDRHRLDERISIDFAAADHVEAAIRLSQALGIGFFNDKPVRHFWLSNKALPLLGWKRVEDGWLILSGDRTKINLTLTRATRTDATEPRQPPAALSLRVDQAQHAGTIGLWEDGATCKVCSSMMSFPTPPGEKITITGTVEGTRPDPKTGTTSQIRIPFRFQDLALPDGPLPPPTPETSPPPTRPTIDEF